MPELRKDPLMGRWVIIATERARRPGNFVNRQRNIFTDSQDQKLFDNQNSEIYAVKAEEREGAAPWKVRVVPSGSPLLSSKKRLQRSGHGIYDVLSGYGVHEIVIDTPDPIINMADLDRQQIRWVIETYVSRIQALEKKIKLAYAFIFKNYGEIIDDKLGHSYSQIIGAPVVPLHIEEKLSDAARYFDFHERCLYMDLIRQERSDRKRIVTETDHFVALMPFASRFPFEVMIIPKQQDCDFARGVEGKEEDLAGIIKDILMRFKVGLGDPAYTFVINSAPFRRKGTNGSANKNVEESYCWHIELTPKLTQVAGFEKGTEFYICPIPPEETAEYLRTVELEDSDE